MIRSLRLGRELSEQFFDPREDDFSLVNLVRRESETAKSLFLGLRRPVLIE
jgi:hypothetical protein